MAQDPVFAIDTIMVPLSAQELAQATDPLQDPACAMPSYPTEHAPAQDRGPIPDIATITAALDAHARGADAPMALMQDLLGPFCANITLSPGNGTVRPPYAITIPLLDASTPYQSTRRCADMLHAIATTLAGFPIGARAPKGAPVFACHKGRVGSIDIPAAHPGAIHKAVRAASGRSSYDIHVPLTLTHADLVHAVRAARTLAAQRTERSAHAQKKAHALLGAIEDIRFSTLAALRAVANTTNRLDATYCIGVHTQAVKTINTYATLTGHEQLAFTRAFYPLQEACLRAMARHPILEELPQDSRLELSIDNRRKSIDIEIIDSAQSWAYQGAYFRDFSHGGMADMAHLFIPKVETDACTRSLNWEIAITQDKRTLHDLSLEGPTLAHALLAHAWPSTKSGPREHALVDLLLDLTVGRHGAPCAVHAVRIF